ncbi:MAG: IS3 family transposase [Gammaproteobacteria bacterium]
MKKTRFTEEQLVKMLREADKTSVPEVAKKYGVSDQTLYNWRKHFGGLDPADVKRLRQLEQENARLKKLVAERDLEIEVMKEIAFKKMVSVQARRQQVGYARQRGLSERRACTLLNVARSALHYRSRLSERDAPILSAMKDLSAQYPRYGYRRIQVFLERDGFAMSTDKAHRLWKLSGLQVPRKRPRRRPSGTRLRPQAPTMVNQVWAYDFVYDACANGQQLKCLTVVDEYTRESLAIDVSGSIRSGRVIDVLARLISERGQPAVLRSDNGPEFVSKAILRWAVKNQLETALIDPGKPWQNGTNESFNGKFRDECLAMEWFRNRREAKVVIETWRRHYNEIRPHSSLGQQTPAAFRRSCGFAAKPEANFQ